MRKYFGTDGIRRIANTELTPELVYKVSKAAAYVFSKELNHTPLILIGKDTRLSGNLIESSMKAGLLGWSKCNTSRSNANTSSSISYKKIECRCKYCNISISQFI